MMYWRSSRLLLLLLLLLSLWSLSLPKRGFYGLGFCCHPVDLVPKVLKC